MVYPLPSSTDSIFSDRNGDGFIYSQNTDFGDVLLDAGVVLTVGLQDGITSP